MMIQIKQRKVTVRDLIAGYVNTADGEADSGDGHPEAGDVRAYGGHLDVRPAFQRGSVYKDKERDAVIDTVIKGLPLNVMYWGADTEASEDFELIDGQQRTLAICGFVSGDFSFGGRYFDGLPAEDRERILGYDLLVFVCTGTEEERLKWFRTINIAGKPLNGQELRNSVYTGPWLADAKRYFSKRNGPAKRVSKGYLDGTPDRQELLEAALVWRTADGLNGKKGEKAIEEYMGIHRQDADAEDLWMYFREVIDWAKRTFPVMRRQLATQNWGKLYLRHGSERLSPAALEAEICRLMADSDVTDKNGIYEYVLDRDPSHLHIRAFDENTRVTVYERQDHRCPRCLEEGNGREYALNEMDADHIVEWVNGGHTSIDNCMMLCRRHNRSDKSWKRGTA